MSKVDQYRRGLDVCLSNAAKAPTNELRAVWQTIAKSYAFLAELELSPGGTLRFANGHDGQSALFGQPINECPTDDRIRS